LDKYRFPTVEWNILHSFLELQVLSLNGVGFASLENFPPLPKLKKLELSDNLISGGLHFLKDAGLINLVSLNLSGNKIGKMIELQPLSYLDKLQSLDLYGCAVTNTPDYQITVFSLIPSLRALDRFDINFKGIRDDDDESTQEDCEREKDGPKTKPPPQNGKLFNSNHSQETLDYKLYGNYMSVRLDLDNVVSNVKLQAEFSLSKSAPSPPLAPLPSPPTSPATPRLDVGAEASIMGAALKLFQEGAGDSSDDEDFDPDEESAGESSSGEESEGEEYSSGGEDEIPNLKRNRTESLLEEGTKKQKQ